MARKLIFAGVGIVALGVVGLSSVFVVQEQEQAIVLQLGAFVRVEQRPGLHFKLPFVQDVRTFDKRVLDFEADLGEINTADQKQTLVDTYTRYRITDPLKFLQTAGSIEAFEARRDDAPEIAAVGFVHVPAALPGTEFYLRRRVRLRCWRRFGLEGL